VKLSDVLIGIIALTVPGALLAADDWRGQPTGDRMTLSPGVYETYLFNDITLAPDGFEDDPGLYSSARALLTSLNSLFDANVGYLGAGMEIRGNDADAALFLADAGLRWQPSRNLGVGLSYAMLQSDGEYSSNSSDADLDLDSVGPHLTLNIAF
jgi:hypothetical protein